jgi:uncharacterized membrane protein YwaF
MAFDSDFWIVRPFNGVFLLMFAFFLLLLVVSSILLRNKSEKLRQTVLVSACIVTMIGFFIYKYCLSLDEEFNVITASTGGFNWWGELPLQMCNINMILIPIAVLKKSKPLMSFCFFVGPLGAMMALAMPGTGFDGYPLYLPRMLGYYGTHFMIVIEGLAIVTYGFYRPAFRDLLPTILTTFVISFCVFLFNMLLRWTQLHPNANYFFSVETEGNPLLELFYSWIPVIFLYQVPCVLILGVYMLLITSAFALADRLRAKKAPAQS